MVLHRPVELATVSQAESSAGDGKFGLRIWKKPGELLLRKLPDHFRQRFLGPPHA